jgi:putative ABC transport system permease protein
MKETIDIFRNVINIISLILVVFSFIAIGVSCMMVFILTNNRVMERIKEIGILRSLGARSIDITTLFNIENLIIGIISSVIGIVFMMWIKNPVNVLIEMLLEESNVFKIYVDLVVGCLFFNNRNHLVYTTYTSGYGY